MSYDAYNREERYLCCHLFRLLHEPVDDLRALRTFLGAVEPVHDFRIFAEVALIRDAYHHRKGEPVPFMEQLVSRVLAQLGLQHCTPYSSLPAELRMPTLTHPQDILRKGGDRLTMEDISVYGAIQGLFKAKPDLVICVGSRLIAYEAKFTLNFDPDQLKRTKQIAELWAELLYPDLGFDLPPTVEVRKLGMRKFDPDVSWEEVAEIAAATYPPGDRTRHAFAHAVSLAG